MSTRVVHFEIPSDQPDLLIDFYSNVFGWRFERFRNQEYWNINTGDEMLPGINGAIMRPVEKNQPSINTIAVDDIEDMMQKIVKAGGRIVKPKMLIPSVGSLAFFADPDGNCHGILEQADQANAL